MKLHRVLPDAPLNNDTIKIIILLLVFGGETHFTILLFGCDLWLLKKTGILILHLR